MRTATSGSSPASSASTASVVIPGIRRSSTATSGGVGADVAQRRGGVAARADQLEVRGAHDRRREPVEVHGMIVGDEHPDRPVSRHHRTSF